MFSSKRRRASTVSDVVDGADDIVVLARAGTHAMATTRSTRCRPDERFVDAIHLWGNVPEMLTGDGDFGDSVRLLTNDLLENGNSTRERDSIHYERG